MKRLVLATIALAALAQAATASAGCWATVGLAPPPASVGAGDTWTAQITVLMHGETPLPDAANAQPTLTIVNDETGARKTFTAGVTKDPTVFETAVVFPAAGAWRYEVNDGFTAWENGEPAPCAQTHTFGSVEIGGAAGGGSSSGPGTATPVPAASETSFPVRPVVGGALAALLALAVSLVLVRRRRGGEVAPS